MQCPQCGSPNDVGNHYCKSCGNPFGIKCEVCSHINGVTNRFCGQCGTRLVSKGVVADPSSQRLLRALSTKGGERKRPADSRRRHTDLGSNMLAGVALPAQRLDHRARGGRCLAWQ